MWPETTKPVPAAPSGEVRQGALDAGKKLLSFAAMLAGGLAVIAVLTVRNRFSAT